MVYRLGFRLALRPAFCAAGGLARNLNRSDSFDSFYTGIARAADRLYRDLSRQKMAHLRWYAAGMAGGTVVLIGVCAVFMILVWLLVDSSCRWHSRRSRSALEFTSAALDLPGGGYR